ncbi:MULTISPECIES: hypothetical protein [Agrobacterium]|uniref:hypothetical protein n=1 Tax=Agrobacterium TaxID=357 RepID=UPI0011C3D5E5|nr:MULTISPECIES: hypothetical protein [Agrobacterium]
MIFVTNPRFRNSGIECIFPSFPGLGNRLRDNLADPAPTYPLIPLVRDLSLYISSPVSAQIRFVFIAFLRKVKKILIQMSQMVRVVCEGGTGKLTPNFAPHLVCEGPAEMKGGGGKTVQHVGGPQRGGCLSVNRVDISL